MKWFIFFIILTLNSLASNNNDNYYDFLQPLVIDLESNQTQQSSTNKEETLERFKSLAYTAPNSNEFYYLNYKLMQEFQYLHFDIKIKEHNTPSKRKKLFIRNKNIFIKILDSIKQPSFFTLYSKLYLEILDSKRLKHSDLMKLYSLSSREKQPYVQLLSYLDSLNQLNSISIVDQNILHKKLTLLLLGLPKQQQSYILRLTALQLLPLYDKESIEFEFNKLFAQKSKITRDNILNILNFKDADLFKEYIMKKRRSFFEKRVFDTIMKSLKHNDIAMILSILYMQKDAYDKARSYIRQTPRNNLYSKYNPFSTSIELNNKRVYKKSSNLRKFAETMSRLELRLQRESPTAKDYYLYGNGLYNKSCFGNFPKSSLFFYSKDMYIDNIPPTCNLDKAYSSYENALQNTITDKFKAEIAYQLLKIKFYKALTDKNNYPKWMKKVPKTTESKEIKLLLRSSRGFIEALKDYKLDYAHTKYGKRVIKESVLFNYL